MISILFNITILILAGFLIIKLFKIQLPSWGILGKGSILFGIGTGFISLQMFFYSILRISFSQFSITAPWLLLLIILLLKNLPNLKNITFLNKKINCFKTIKPLEWLIGILLFLIIVLVFLQSIFFPLTAWDGWAMWSFKAKVFFLEKTISPQFLTNPAYSYSAPDHPLLFPLIQTWLSMGLNNFDDQFIKILSFLFFSGILIIFYKLLRSKTTRIISLLITFLLATTPIFRESGYLQWGADLPLSYYILGTIFFLKLWLNKREKSSLILAAIFLGFSAWTKNEGIMFAAIVTFFGIVSIIFKRDEIKYIKIYLISILIPLIINIPWQIFKEVNKIPMSNLSFINIFNKEFFQRLEHTVIFLLNQILDLSNWSLGLILLIVIPFAFWKINKKNSYSSIFFLYLIISFQLIGYFLVIAFTGAEINWQLETAFQRLLLQVFPSIFLLSSFLVINKSQFNIKKKFLTNVQPNRRG